jgi:uncharacterized protein (TIGR03437 family)
MRALLIFCLCAPLGSAQNAPSFRWSVETDSSGSAILAGLGTDAAGNSYLAGTSGNHVFATKLDAAGNVVYSKRIGGTGVDTATAMTVDAAGNLFVTGVTTSKDFPTTVGSYSPGLPPPPPPAPVYLTATSFVFRLNPDGSVGYSTYFTASQTMPTAIGVDNSGSAYVTGYSYGGLATTPGAYQTTCDCAPTPTTFLLIGRTDGFVTRFNSAGSQLLYSTYFGPVNTAAKSIAVAPDGSAYAGADTGVYRLDASGSALLASTQAGGRALALATDGGIYIAGLPGPFAATAGAFLTAPPMFARLPGPNGTLGTIAEIVKMDAGLQNVLAATYFGGLYGVGVEAMAVDPAGDLYIGGSTSQRSLPTRTPFVQGFGLANGTGYLAELSGDLTTLEFSSPLGDNENYEVTGIGLSANGSVVAGGFTGIGTGPQNVWVNSLALQPPPALRIDSVVNAASLLSDPVSGGETVLVRGASFGNGAQLLVGGVAVPAISTSPTEITVAIPAELPAGAAEFIVQSGGAVSNTVLVSVAATSPGLFSADGSGVGPGYILNKDGTLNTPANPAAQGDPITIYATGAGPLSFVGPYAVSAFPSNVFIDGVYCDGVAAYLGPVAGFTGNVYRQTVFVPNLPGFHLPPLAGIVLQLNGASSQSGLSISIAQ